MNNPYFSYQRSQVEGSDRGTLVLLLYEGALRFMNEAIEAFEASDYKKGFSALVRVNAIIQELLASLNLEKGGVIAENLYKLYEFVLWKIFMAEKEKNVQHLKDALYIVSELKSAWKEALDKEKAKVEPKKKQESGKEATPSISITG